MQTLPSHCLCIFQTSPCDQSFNMSDPRSDFEDFCRRFFANATLSTPKRLLSVSVPLIPPKAV